MPAGFTSYVVRIISIHNILVTAESLAMTIMHIHNSDEVSLTSARMEKLNYRDEMSKRFAIHSGG
jgi:hypothetical protein